jgi:hypothetical protein
VSRAEEHRHLLADVAARLDDVDALDPAAREVVYGLLDAVDELHRGALRRAGALLGADTLRRLRAADPAIAWLLDAYWVGVDTAAVEAALGEIAEEVRGRGGDLEVVALEAGLVRLHLRGAGMATERLAAAAERALLDGVPGLTGVDVGVDDGPAVSTGGLPTPPDGARLLPLAPRHTHS